jgi:hypothetical protein
MKYTITVLGQDDPDALRTFVAEAADAIKIQGILTGSPALQIVVDGSPEGVHQLCLDLLEAGYATRVTARAHPPVV